MFKYLKRKHVLGEEVSDEESQIPQPSMSKGKVKVTPLLITATCQIKPWIIFEDSWFHSRNKEKFLKKRLPSMKRPKKQGIQWHEGHGHCTSELLPSCHCYRPQSPLLVIIQLKKFTEKSTASTHYYTFAQNNKVEGVWLVTGSKPRQRLGSLEQCIWFTQC